MSVFNIISNLWQSTQAGVWWFVGYLQGLSISNPALYWSTTGLVTLGISYWLYRTFARPKEIKKKQQIQSIEESSMIQETGEDKPLGNVSKMAKKRIIVRFPREYKKALKAQMKKMTEDKKRADEEVSRSMLREADQSPDQSSDSHVPQDEVESTVPGYNKATQTASPNKENTIMTCVQDNFKDNVQNILFAASMQMWHEARDNYSFWASSNEPQSERKEADKHYSAQQGNPNMTVEAFMGNHTSSVSVNPQASDDYGKNYGIALQNNDMSMCPIGNQSLNPMQGLASKISLDPLSQQGRFDPSVGIGGSMLGMVGPAATGLGLFSIAAPLIVAKAIRASHRHAGY